MPFFSIFRAISNWLLSICAIVSILSLFLHSIYNRSSYRLSNRLLYTLTLALITFHVNSFFQKINRLLNQLLLPIDFPKLYWYTKED